MTSCCRNSKNNSYCNSLSPVKVAMNSISMPKVQFTPFKDPMRAKSAMISASQAKARTKLQVMAKVSQGSGKKWPAVVPSFAIGVI